MKTAYDKPTLRIKKFPPRLSRSTMAAPGKSKMLVKVKADNMFSTFPFRALFADKLNHLQT
jgi:hypothetical protein